MIPALSLTPSFGEALSHTQNGGGVAAGTRVFLSTALILVQD